VKFGLFIPAASPFVTPETLAKIGQCAEERGIDTLWVPEHVVLFEDYASQYPYAEDGRIPSGPGVGMLEPFTSLAFLAAHTKAVRLGTAICLLPQRNPVYSAKEAANIDYLSNGRFEFGIGVGWLREEFDAVNVPWPNRGARTDEYIAVMKALWGDDPSEFHGEFYDLPPCSMFPKPVQSPHPPLVIGGESEAAMRRVARLGDSWHTFNREPHEMPPLLARLDELLAEHGRTRADVTVTASPYMKPMSPEIVEGFAETGVDQVTGMLMAFGPDDVEPRMDELAECVERAHAAG
jgi:probable F420-dependent oxidoreductase